MKNNFLVTLCCALFLTLAMTSCQKEEIGTPNAQIGYRAASWTHTPSSPCAGDDLTVTFNNGLGGSCGNIQIQQWDGTEWIQVAMGNPVNGTLSYTVNDAPSGTYKFRGQWFKQSCGGSNSGWIEYEVVVVTCGCDESLSAAVTCSSDACNRSVTFTYVAGDDHNNIVVQGGLTHFTSICTATATGGLVQNTTHNSVLNSNSNVTRWEASGVEECDELTVTISWTSTNNAALITGKWTVKDGNGNTLAYLCPLDCAGNSAEICE